MCVATSRSVDCLYLCLVLFSRGDVRYVCFSSGVWRERKRERRRWRGRRGRENTSADKILLTFSRAHTGRHVYVREHGIPAVRTLSLSLFFRFSFLCSMIQTCMKRRAFCILAIDRWRIAISHSAFLLASLLLLLLLRVPVIPFLSARLCVSFRPVSIPSNFPRTSFPRPINSLSMILFGAHTARRVESCLPSSHTHTHARAHQIRIVVRRDIGCVTLMRSL